MQLRAYHNDQTIKDKYLARVRAHREADNLIQGTGWDDGRGCAVGCTLENYDHSRYPVELGLPEWLAHLEDSIFEFLPKTEAMAWPESFLEAINPGADLEPVRHKLAIRRIDRLTALQTAALEKNHAHNLHEAIQGVLAAQHQVRHCHVAEIGGSSCDLPAAESVALAAWSALSMESAALSMESAARSAAWSARSAARSATTTAQSAALAARSAAWSVGWSAALSMRSAESIDAAWKQEADDLLELLRDAK